MNPPSLKIYVDEDGVYHISGNDLEKAGANLSEIDPKTLKLFNQGQEIPIRVSNEGDGKLDAGDYIEFYGQFNHGEKSYYSPYSLSNVYWLSWGGSKGLRMAEMDGGLYEKDPSNIFSPPFYKATTHIEQDRYFDRLLLVTDESRDHWFWQTMNAYHTYEFKFNLQQPVATTDLATVRVMLHGSTHPAAYPDHHTIIRLNGYLIEDATWDSQTEHFLERKDIPNSILKDGENVLSIELPGDTQAGEVDQVLFNWCEVDYWRSFKAVDDFIKLKLDQASGVLQFSVNGFSSDQIAVLDNRGRRLTNFEVVKKGHTYTAIFQDKVYSFNLPLTYYVFTPNAVKRPAQIVRDDPSDLKSARNGADYIIITHEQFLDAIIPLANHRTAQGYRVKIVKIQDIYDEFSYGIYDPWAIQRFLRYAYEHWQPPAPLYVLLVGDASWGYDTQAARSWGRPSYLPTIMRYTVSWGMTSSDNVFVCVSGDDRLPDMFIGRLPVNSLQEAETVVTKILQYEQHPTIGEWRKNVCLSVGNGSFFEESAEYLYNNYIPKSFDVPRLYTNPKSPYFGSTEELVDIFNNGTALLNFIGHGGGGVFFDAELFLLEDIGLLHNSLKLPIVFSLTCFVGYFDNPRTPSLGEELLRAAGKGIVAHFGSAGRAWIYGDYFLNIALFESLFTNNGRILGRVTTEAKWQLMSWYGGYWDMVENYNLLGDPALRIGFPKENVSLKITPPSLQPGEVLEVQGTVSQNPSGQVKLTVYNPADSLIATHSASVVNGLFQANLQLPQNIKQGQGALKAYFWNSATDGIGAISFGIGVPYICNVTTEPPQPGHLDSTYISAQVVVSPFIAPQGIDSVFCSWLSDQYGWEKIPMMAKGGDLYRTQRPIIRPEGYRTDFKILAVYRKGAEVVTIESKVYSYTVRRRADLTMSPSTVSITGQETVLIRGILKNTGGTEAKSFTVEFYDGNPGSGGVKIGGGLTVDALKAQNDTVLYVPWNGNPHGSHTLYVLLDAENRINEVNESNNTLSKLIHLLTIRDGSGGWLTSADSNFAVNIPPNTLTSNTSIEIQLKSFEDIGRETPIPSNLTPATLASGLPLGYIMELADTTLDIVKPVAIQFVYAETDSLTHQAAVSNRLKIYYWDKRTDQWLSMKCDVNINQHRVHGECLSTNSLFGLFINRDVEPPQITLHIQGQGFADGDYVSAAPIISAVIEDESGIDTVNRPLSITLDGQPVAAQDFRYAKSPTSSNTVLVTYTPSLTPGNHELRVDAYDINGNLGTHSISFQVSQGLELQAIANHPNPFTEETVIAYTLTEQAQEVKLQIYTTAGRLIRNFEFAAEMGYVEHVWDGRDEFGNEVANGVYYLRFVARRGKQRIERIEKMAKLK